MTTVKYVHSDMTGAPALTGQAGSMLALLDAVLVNGFTTQTVDSVVVSGGIATVTRASGHPFEVGAVALLAGATPSALSGQKRVLSATATQYTFDATGVADGAATGTITHKVAPLGWNRAFSGTNVGAYKSSNVAASGMFLRVDDVGAQSARVVAYETMSDVNTGTGPFPTAAQQSGGLYWQKSATADSTIRAWEIAGDDRAFYMRIQFNAAGALTVYFGDFLSKKVPDPYACAVAGSVNGSTGATSDLGDVAYTAGSNTSQGFFVARAYTGVGGSVQAARAVPAVPFNPSSAYSGAVGQNPLSYPNPADNGIYLAPISVVETAVVVMRGVMPGVYFCPMKIGTSVFSTREVLDNISGLSGRRLRTLLNTQGPLFADVTGPWR